MTYLPEAGGGYMEQESKPDGKGKWELQEDARDWCRSLGMIEIGEKEIAHLHMYGLTTAPKPKKGSKT